MYLLLHRTTTFENLVGLSSLLSLGPRNNNTMTSTHTAASAATSATTTIDLRLAELHHELLGGSSSGSASSSTTARHHEFFDALQTATALERAVREVGQGGVAEEQIGAMTAL